MPGHTSAAVPGRAPAPAEWQPGDPVYSDPKIHGHCGPCLVAWTAATDVCPECGEPSTEALRAALDVARAELALANSALVLCRWLITLDDPEHVQGREDRRTVTLTQICNKAREALGRVGEYPPPRSKAAELACACVLCNRGGHVCPGCGEATPHLRDDVAAACIRCAVEHDVVDRRVAPDLPDTAEAARGA